MCLRVRPRHKHWNDHRMGKHLSVKKLNEMSNSFFCLLPFRIVIASSTSSKYGEPKHDRQRKEASHAGLNSTGSGSDPQIKNAGTSDPDWFVVLIFNLSQPFQLTRLVSHGPDHAAEGLDRPQVIGHILQQDPHYFDPVYFFSCGLCLPLCSFRLGSKMTRTIRTSTIALLLLAAALATYLLTRK
jgi:hypothetical protein